jgi:hemolysin III
MLHLVAFPVAVVLGTLLVTVIADGRTAKIGSAVFALSSVILFGVSAVYHRGHWNDRTRAVLRRLDHANIFLMIAGTYTPLTLTLVDGTSRVVVLTVVWVGAVAGMIFRVVWLSAPRWLYTPFYVALGWVAIGVMPTLWREGGATVVTLLIIGGVAYSVGAVVYGLRRPDPAPQTFGYHEVFHSCTLVGYACHYVAAALAVS